MNTNSKTQTVNFFQTLNICFDVGKDKLNFYFVVGEQPECQICEGEFRNSLPVITEKLTEFRKTAEKYGINKIRVICEPTGGYQDKLLKTARRLGLFTSYVNAESVAKFRVVESNDTGKTDRKDPKIIHTLASLNKILKHRVLENEFLLLRKLNQRYERIEKKFVRQKCQIHHCLKELFCDFSFKKDFLYGPSGRILMKAYGCNPFEITKRNKQYFISRMKRHNSRIHLRTLNRIWDDAKSSILNELDSDLIKELVDDLKTEWEECLRHEEKREQIKQEMIRVLQQLRSKKKNIPPAVHGLITEFHVARIIAETGPMEDFKSIQQLYRYAGLNIRQYSSCQMKGKDRICKKGRSLLRKSLSQVIISTTKRERYYGDYYHRKKATGVKGNKIMVSLMRKFLKTFYGIYKNGGEYDEKRVFTCESQLRQTA